MERSQVQEAKTLALDTAMFIGGTAIALSSEVIPDDIPYPEIAHHGTAVTGLVLATIGIWRISEALFDKATRNY